MTRVVVLSALAWIGLATPGCAAAAVPVVGAIEPGPAATVPGSYLVVLRDQADVSAVARSVGYRFGGRVGHTYRHALNGFEVAVTEAAARRIAADPAVAYVQRNGVYRADEVQTDPPSWGLDRIDQATRPLDNAYAYPSTAPAVTAYILDSGLTFGHEDFGGRATSGPDMVANDNDSTDCNGHGTHVAGTVGGAKFGVAKAVHLVGVRVLDCSGEGSTAEIVAGVDWVTEHAQKPAVANMSLGGGPDPALDRAVNESIDSGITYSLSAGNGDSRGNGRSACGLSPGRVPDAITVSATDSEDQRPRWANIGPCVDIFAPGVGIRSDYNDGGTATMTGTSMAAPHVTGTAALILEAHPSWTPRQVRDEMVALATPGVVTDPGDGSPDRLLRVPAQDCLASDPAGLAIPDDGTPVESTVQLADCAEAASNGSTVEVHVTHPYRGDLEVSLVAPDGQTYPLKEPDLADGAERIDETYAVELAAAPGSGAWRLRLRDVYLKDSGRLDSWTLTR